MNIETKAIIVCVIEVLFNLSLFGYLHINHVHAAPLFGYVAIFYMLYIIGIFSKIKKLMMFGILWPFIFTIVLTFQMLLFMQSDLMEPEFVKYIIGIFVIIIPIQSYFVMILISVYLQIN